MQLSKADAEQFFKLYPALLVYVNAQKKILKGVSTAEEIMGLPPEETFQVRSKLYQDIGIIDSFVRDNPYGFSSEELNIVSSWKSYVQGDFYLLRHLKKYSIFLTTSSSPVAYGVLSLMEDLEDMLPYVPVLVWGTLLPFKNRIVYDGHLSIYRVSFGGGIRKSLNDSYNEAKAIHGIVTSLPFDASEQTEIQDEERLKFYLKNERNRQYYADDIEKLISRSHDLRVLFHQEMGKINARSLGKRLRDIGFSNVWFGILQGMVVASGQTKEDLKANISAVVPKSMQEYVYLYHLKPSKKT